MPTMPIPATSNAVKPQRFSLDNLKLNSVPGQLWLRQMLIFVVTLVVAAIAYLTFQSYDYVVKTIGKDAVPSIVAAEKIRTTLADAHTQIINVFLTGEATDGANMQAYSKSIEQAHEHLLAAAQNITYGEEERRPILAIMTQLSKYERLVGMAWSDKEHMAQLGKADALMREQILPAVIALDQANFSHLASAYTEGQKKARYCLYGFIAAALLLAFILIETQLKLYASFKRMFNPALALGLTLFALAMLLFCFKVTSVMSEVRSAKEDAFDSVHALSQAKAIAYSANAQESFYLLSTQKEQQAQQSAFFQNTAKQLFDLPMTELKQSSFELKQLKGHGLLGDELSNITYQGEEESARATLKAWLDYIKIDGQIRSLEATGRHAEAVVLCLGTKPMESDWAFENFIRALDATLDINQQQFELAVARATLGMRWLWLLLLPILLAPLLGSVIGLQQRLAEFRE